MTWDNLCSWCSAKRCVQNTVDYDNTQVPSAGSNCFLPDDSCYHSYRVGNSTSNELCQLSVSVSLLSFFSLLDNRLIFFSLFLVGLCGLAGN